MNDVVDINEAIFDPETISTRDEDDAYLHVHLGRMGRGIMPSDNVPVTKKEFETVLAELKEHNLKEQELYGKDD